MMVRSEQAILQEKNIDVKVNRLLDSVDTLSSTNIDNNYSVISYRGVNELKLNLGCGTKYLNDFINIDLGLFNDNKGIIEPDIICDLEYGIPLDNESVDYILVDNVIEHLSDVYFFCEECHRVLKVGGHLRVITPHYRYHSSWHNIDHKHHFGENLVDEIVPLGFHVIQNRVYNKFIPIKPRRFFAGWYFPCVPTTIDFTLKKQDKN